MKPLRWVDLMVSKWLDGYGTRMNEYAERMQYPYGRGLGKCCVNKASSENKGSRCDIVYSHREVLVTDLRANMTYERCFEDRFETISDLFKQ